MFYAACEKLASERPELKQFIEKVDELLSQNVNRLVTIDLLRAQVNASNVILETIFEELLDTGAFSSEQALFCIEHDQCFPSSETCDLCDVESTQEMTETREAIRPPTPDIQVSNMSELENAKPVRVLISYSHDSPKHAERVSRLSDQLSRRWDRFSNRPI